MLFSFLKIIKITGKKIIIIGFVHSSTLWTVMDQLLFAHGRIY